MTLADEDPLDIHGQAQAKQEAADRKRLEREQEADDLRWLMGDKRGRRVVWRWLEEAGIYRTTFRMNSEMAFLEGRRSMGLKVLAQVHEICPEQYGVMVQEAQKAKKGRK